MMPDDIGLMIQSLRSIDATLKELLALSKTKRAATPAPAAEPPIDANLDDPKWGDPVVKFLPRDWTGDEFRHQKFSECSPEFLDQLAKAFDWFAEKKKADNDPGAKYEVLNAARARGWAARLRGGWKPKEMIQESEVGW